MASFQAIQNQFADHIRDPESNPPIEGLEDRRLGIYRELFFNNVLGFLASGFPVLKSLFAEDRWTKLAREFFSQHVCRSPYFVDISKEFVEFLSNEYTMQGYEPPCMLELAHYEWIELALSTRVQEEEATYWDGESPVNSIKFSELAELLSYSYPVHQISPEHQPEAGETPTYLVVNRNQNDDVRFTEINAITAHLLNVVKSHDDISIDALVEHMCTEIQQIPKEQISAGAMQIIQQMLQAEILLPTS